MDAPVGVSTLAMTLVCGVTVSGLFVIGVERVAAATLVTFTVAPPVDELDVEERVVLLDPPVALAMTTIAAVTPRIAQKFR